MLEQGKLTFVKEHWWCISSVSAVIWDWAQVFWEMQVREASPCLLSDSSGLAAHPPLHHVKDITCANYELHKMHQTDAIITVCHWTVSFSQQWTHYLIYSLAKELFSALI